MLVNAIAPGPIDTEINAFVSDDWKKRLTDLPIGRIGLASEVAPTAVFLASTESSYYVGQTLGPDGGDVML